MRPRLASSSAAATPVRVPWRWPRCGCAAPRTAGGGGEEGAHALEIRPSPEADPYVSEGDSIEAGQVVGLVEIMKNFHEITSEESGTIARILVESEDLVEAGQDIIELS